MAKEFKLPDLGEGIHEAQILEVSVKEGDTVKEDQTVMEVETDKAAVPIPVPFAGVIAKLFVKPGDTVKVGQPLLAVESAGGAPAKSPGSSASQASPPRPAPQQAPASSQRQAPRPGPAAAPARPATGVPTTTSRPTSTPAPQRSAPAPAARAPAAPTPSAPRRPEAVTSGPIPAAPAVRRMAREMNVDLRDVHGTGPGGRIVREDVERFNIAGPQGTGAARGKPGVSRGEASSGRPAAEYPDPAVSGRAAEAESLPDFSQWGPVRREPITQIRKTIARQMVRSYTHIPHVTHCDVADVTDLETFRKQHGEVFKEKGNRLTLTAFIIKAVAGGLQQHPELNCSFDEVRGEIIYKDYVHIGVAVDTPRGLVVPVCRDCDKKKLVQIAADLAGIAERARAAKFEIADLRGGTFTVTNVGALGGTFVTPMINYPEVAILGLGRTALQPVVRNGQIVPRMMLPLSLSFDHRVIDGANAARFVRTVIDFLENPLNLLLVS